MHDVSEVEVVPAKLTEPPSLLQILTLRWRFVHLKPWVVYLTSDFVVQDYTASNGPAVAA